MTNISTADERRRESLYVTDAELIRRLGVPEKIARRNIRELDGKAGSGFPRKQKLWGDRRYWPDVKAYFDMVSRAKISASPQRKQS